MKLYKMGLAISMGISQVTVIAGEPQHHYEYFYVAAESMEDALAKVHENGDTERLKIIEELSSSLTV